MVAIHGLADVDLPRRRKTRCNDREQRDSPAGFM